MSSLKHDEGLRRLCFQYGWSYAVFWHLESDGVSENDPELRLLKAGRSYYEDNLGELMSNILHQVHRLGEGVIGGAALSGKWQWIFSDTCLSEDCLKNSPLFHGSRGGCDLQFLAGIKTIATFPLQSLGGVNVMQFGSSQKILENLEFINIVQDMIQSTDFLSDLLTNKNLNMDSKYNAGGLMNTPALSCHQQYPTTDSSLDSHQSSNTQPLLLQKPCPLFTGNSWGFDRDFVKDLSPSPSPLALVASSHDPTTWNNEILARMEQQLLNIIETDGAAPPASSSGNCGNVNNSDIILSDDELFDGIELDLGYCNHMVETAHGHYWEDVLIPDETTASLRECIPELGVRSEKVMLSECGIEQVVNKRLVASSTINENSTVVSPNSRNSQYSTMTNIPVNMKHIPSAAANLVPVVCGGSSRTTMQVPSGNLVHLKSEVSPWFDDCCSINASMNSSLTHSYKLEEHPKVMAGKRARPSETTRPRPKDRQMIQDRVKELREIVPNATKCSIDSLLDRTIKHIVYSQNMTIYAEKMKQADDYKVIADKSNGGSAGATWAVEVPGENIDCPIIIQDLSPPGQMHVEMLCEEKGLFLEIADVIRGFDMVILKGVMEPADSKIRAKFLVEANREVTRMEIFPSLVNLLQKNTQKHPSHSSLNN